MSTEEGSVTVSLGGSLVVLLVLLVAGLMWGLPKYGVWRANLAGQAELVRAEQNRRIKVEEAKANLEAERMNAEAEVERAKGAAKAIEIENGKLTDTYIKYLWVRQQGQCSSSVVYIPTEAGLPILEAGRRP